MAYHPLKDGGTLIREVTNRKKIHLHNNLELAVGTADELCLLLLSFKKYFPLVQHQEKKSYYRYITVWQGIHLQQ